MKHWIVFYEAATESAMKRERKRHKKALLGRFKYPRPYRILESYDMFKGKFVGRVEIFSMKLPVPVFRNSLMWKKGNQLYVE